MARTFGGTLDAVVTDTRGNTIPGINVHAWDAPTAGAALGTTVSGVDGSFELTLDTTAPGIYVSAGTTGPRRYVPAREAVPDLVTSLANKTNNATTAALSDRVDTTETRVGTVEDEIGGRLSAPVLSSTFAVGVDDVASVLAGTPAEVPALSFPLFMDSAGRLLRGNGSALQRSDDDGQTWATVHTFPTTVAGVRQMDTGELLVGLAHDGAAATVKAKVYRSTGYQGGAPTFALVLTADDYGQNLDLSWGFGGAGSVYAVSEYDSKATGSRSAVQHAWLTEDAGATWSPIYDHGTGSGSFRHIHGVAYDPHRDAVWLVAGDYDSPGDGARFIKVSWDRGQTWDTVTTEHQPTAIMVFPDCVAFGTDNAPNGVLRIDNPAPDSLEVKVAYRLNRLSAGTTMILSHVAETPFRAAGGYLTLLPFSAVVPGQPGLVLGSFDGYAWFEVWRDSRTYSTSSRGPFKAIGPTPDGTIHISGRDDSATSWFLAKVPAPANPGLLSTVTRLSRAFTRATPRRSFVSYNNSSTPFQTVQPYTYTTVLLHGLPSSDSENYSGLFERASDGSGVVVTRDALVSIDADNCVNIGAGINSFVVLQIDGVTQTLEGGTRVHRTIRVRAGQKVSVQAFILNSSAQTLNGSSALALDAWEVHEA